MVADKRVKSSDFFREIRVSRMTVSCFSSSGVEHLVALSYASHCLGNDRNKKKSISAMSVAKKKSCVMICLVISERSLINWN